MAVEPNTNPGKGEGEKPAREKKAAPAASYKRATRASTAKTTRKSTRKTTAKAAEEKRSNAESPAMEDAYMEFVADIQRMSGEATKAFQALQEKTEAEVEKLKNDVVASDPTKAFIQDLTEAARASDMQAVTEAYTSLYTHTVQRQAAAEKRLSDILTTYYENVVKLVEEAQDDFRKEAKEYADVVKKALENRKVSELVLGDQTVAAHAMYMGAMAETMEK